MTKAVRNASARQIFDQVLNAAIEDQYDVLEIACGDDHELRSDVESLLRHHQFASAAFMQPPLSPIGSESIGRASTSLIGKTVGQYRIVSLIKEGGMGVVYRAEQLSLQRQVAIKFIRFGFTKSLVQRFEHETRVLSSLRHRHIAQIHDAGIHEVVGHPMPYFVMELVPDARSITDYAAQQNLGVHAKINLFIQACEGVEFGHRKGIIHRDLKPGNILVDAQNEVKIIDFGVARSVDSDVAATTIQTQVGELVGTLQYMSPEQCDADPNELDTRTDVYSLGVVLYELLAGDLPYEVDGTSIFRATQTIKTQAPRPVSQIRRELRGDIEIIIHKAIEKNADRRYGAVTELRDDLARFLRREPIMARPQSTLRRLLVWIGRHPRLATACISLLIAAMTLGATLITVDILSRSPSRLVLLKEPGRDWDYHGYSAQLLSVTGDILREWGPGTTEALVGAASVDRPEEFGGGRLALIGFSGTWIGDHQGALCAFDINGNLDLPDWTARIKPTDIMPNSHGRRLTADMWHLRRFRLFDVFLDRPGPEIVCVFDCFFSQRIIRVYGVDGALLYQVWHDGSIPHFDWLPKSRLLVFAGDNGAGTAEQRGMINAVRAHPYVLFAIRPLEGRVSDGILSEIPGSGPLNPVWYQCLQPGWAHSAVRRWSIANSGPTVGEPGQSVRVTVELEKGWKFGIAWDVDENGHEIPRSRFWSDDYQQNLDRYSPKDPLRLPDPAQIKLGPLPPIINSHGEIEHIDKPTRADS